MRLIFKTLQPFCIEGDADYRPGSTGYADDRRTAEAVARAHEHGYVTLELGERASGSPLPVMGSLPVMGHVLGDPPTIEHVRRRYKSELFNKLSKLDRALLIADPACPARDEWLFRKKLWDWSPSTEEAREVMAKLESLVRRKLEFLLANYAAKVAAADEAVRRNWETFERAADEAEREAAAAIERAKAARELAAQAAKFAKQKITAEEQARRDAEAAETKARGKLVMAYNGARDLLRYAGTTRPPVPGLEELLDEIRPKLQTATVDESREFVARLGAVVEAANRGHVGDALVV